MEALANVNDYAKFAKKMLSPPMYTHINGEDHIQDSDEFFKIQLKLRGLGNLKNFKDPLGTVILGQRYGSPIGFGAFPHQGMVNKEAEKASAKAAPKPKSKSKGWVPDDEGDDDEGDDE